MNNNLVGMDSNINLARMRLQLIKEKIKLNHDIQTLRNEIEFNNVLVQKQQREQRELAQLETQERNMEMKITTLENLKEIVRLKEELEEVGKEIHALNEEDNDLEIQLRELETKTAIARGQAESVRMQCDFSTKDYIDIQRKLKKQCVYLGDDVVVPKCSCLRNCRCYEESDID